MVIGRLAAARLAVLPFAPALWLLAWEAPRAANWARGHIPKAARGLVGALAGALCLGGIIVAQMDTYSRVSGVRVLENDNYFFTLLLVEIAVALFLIFRLAYRERGKEGPGAAN